MNDILYRAAAYLLIIALGVFLKKVGFFHEQDFRTLAKIFAEYHVALCNYLFIFKSRFSDFAFNSDRT